MIEKIYMIRSQLKISENDVSGSLEYYALDTNNHSDASMILTDRRCPRIHSVVYSQDSNLILGAILSLNISRDGILDGKFRWRINAEIGPLNYVEEDEEDSKNWQISTGSEKIQVARAADVNGRWNVNTNGEWFSEALMETIPLTVWKYSGTLGFNPSRFLDFEEKINEKEIWGLPPFSLLCRNVQFSTNINMIPRKWETSLEIVYNPLSWIDYKANVGFYAWQNGRFNRILNEDGSPLELARLLDREGELLPSGTDPVYLDFQNRKSLDFSDLNLRNPTD